MKIGDVTGFRRDVFFEGAVQLGWFVRKPEVAERAARNFIFHGPEYHGVTEEDFEITERFQLKDTATFFEEVVSNLYATNKTNNFNPFGLAIAGYGTGKSHLSLTLATLLTSYPRELSSCIINNIHKADESSGERIKLVLGEADKPALVVAIDGMKNFNLTMELYNKVVEQLKRKNVDISPILDLSPRFRNAEEFVKRNFILRKELFEQKFGDRVDKDYILYKIAERDEEYFGNRRPPNTYRDSLQ